MKYCYQCNRITAGEPLFCNFCGRSYNLKLCPRLHANPRNAETCSQCGNRDLSTPQPKVPLWAPVLQFFLSLIPGLVLGVLSIGLVALALKAILDSPQLRFATVMLALDVGFLWWVWRRPTLMPNTHGTTGLSGNAAEQKPKRFLPLTSPNLGQSYPHQCPQHCPQEEEAETTASSEPLGEPMNVREVARLIGCSVWTVRQKFLLQGLPHFRSGDSGKLIFYRDQVIRWVLSQQHKKGGSSK